MRKAKQPLHVLSYPWPELKVRESPLGGRGVFAAQDLAVGVAIPLNGPVVTEELDEPLSRYVVQRGRERVLLDPQDLHCVAGLINEPTLGRPNCVIRGAFMVLGQPVKKDEELTVSYGPSYVRDYPVSRSVHRKLVYPRLARFRMK